MHQTAKSLLSRFRQPIVQNTVLWAKLRYRSGRVAGYIEGCQRAEFRPHSSSQGMSLRDYFAGQALALVITEGLRLDQVQGMATRAYQIADAMLAERRKERK